MLVPPYCPSDTVFTPSLNKCAQLNDPTNANGGAVAPSRPFPTTCTSANDLDTIAASALEQSTAAQSATSGSDGSSSTLEPTSLALLLLKPGAACRSGFCVADGTCAAQAGDEASDYVLGLNDFDAAGAGTFSTWMRDNIVGASIVLIAMAFVPCAVFLKQWDRRRVAQDGGLSMVYGGQYEKKCYPTGISSLPEDPAGVPTRPPYRTRTVV